MSIGSNLRRIRKDKKLSQKALAKAVHVGQTTIANYENNQRYPNAIMLSKLADVLDISLDALLDRENKTSMDDEDIDQYADQFISYILDYQEDVAIDMVLNFAKKGYDIVDIYNKFLKETLYRVGDLWEKGQISIPMEHHISFTIDKLMFLLSHYIVPKSSNGKTAVFIAPGSESHLLGLKIVKEIFRKYGWKTFYIGKSVPWNSLVNWVKEHQVEIVVISTTIDQNLNQVEAFVNYIREKSQAKILLGGQAYDKNHQFIQQINPDYYMATDEALINFLEELE